MPVEGRAIFDAGKLSAFRLASQGPTEDFSVVTIEGQPFSRAFRVRVTAKHSKAWDVQILTPPSTLPLKKGEHILAMLSVRCVKSPDGVGGFGAFIQASGPKWIGIGSTDVVTGKKWTRVYIHAQAAQDFGAGQYEMTLHLGSQIQERSKSAALPC